MFGCNPLKMLYLYLKGEDLDVPLSLFLRIMYSIISNKALKHFAPLSVGCVRPGDGESSYLWEAGGQRSEGVGGGGKSHLLLQLRLKSETSL